MGKLVNNPMMKGATGMVGDTFVFRNWRGRLLVVNKPKSGSRTATARQLLVQEKFTVAAAYAKQAVNDPATKAIYETGIGGNKFTAQMVAMSDYLNAPKVREIDASAYHGAAGDEIFVKATDDFKVTKVNVVITGASGVVIESGAAVQDSLNKLLWRYVATQPNAILAGTMVQATAFDLPGNKGSLSTPL